MNFGYRSGLEK